MYTALYICWTTTVILDVKQVQLYVHTYLMCKTMTVQIVEEFHMRFLLQLFQHKAIHENNNFANINTALYNDAIYKCLINTDIGFLIAQQDGQEGDNFF